MKLFENAPDKYADEMKSYFPYWYRGVAEMNAIWDVTGGMMDELRADIARALDNTFMTTCDISAIERLENFLRIKFAGYRTDEERRRFILTLMNGLGKCSATKIRLMIESYTGATVAIRFLKSDQAGNHTLFIEMRDGKYEHAAMSDINTMLAKMIPAHIPFTMTINFDLPRKGNNFTIFFGAALYETKTIEFTEYDRRPVTNYTWLTDENGDTLTDELLNVFIEN